MKNLSYLLFIVVLVACCQNGSDKDVQKEYYPDGTIKASYQYDFAIDSLVCGTRFYPNGKPYKKYCLLNDSLDGDYKEYFENGKLRKSAFYDEGNIDGELKLYYQNGILKEVGIFTEGKRNGVLRIYRKDGTLKATNYAVDDFVHYVELFDEEEKPRGVVNYIPKVSVLEDQIYLDDTLSIEVSIPLPEEEFSLDSIYLNLEIFTEEDLAQNSLPFPRYSYLLEERVIVKRFLFQEEGEFILYGFLSKGEGFDAHKYETFKVPFTSVKNERGVTNISPSQK